MRYLIGSVGDVECPENNFLILPTSEIDHINRCPFSYDIVDKNGVVFSCTYITFVESASPISELEWSDQDPNLILSKHGP